MTKLRASDGANLGTFTVGTNAQGIAFDGADIWVANFGSKASQRVCEDALVEVLILDL